MSIGRVFLVGAGPGDAGLLTLRGAECLRLADLVIADHLVDPLILDKHAAATAERIVRPSGRAELNQEEINRLLVEGARAGKCVVRLKGGDPFVFGRGAEEARVLAEAGIPFEIVPGVTAGVAVPAYAGIPLTHRGTSGVVIFATGHEADDKEGGAIDWSALAKAGGTLVLYMSVQRLAEVAARLISAGIDGSVPTAVIEWGTTTRQRTVIAPLSEVGERAREAKLRPPALTIIGDVVSIREHLNWFEAQPLFGRRILLVTTKDGAVPSSVQGAEVLQVSPLQIVPRFSATKAALGRLEHVRCVALTSAHAADALVGALAAVGRDARALAQIRLAAVGEATARRLAELQLRADVVATGGGEALADELLRIGEAGPVLLLRAAGGREELAERLKTAGIAVEAVEAYETIPDPTAIERVWASHATRPFSAIGFMSPKGAEAFLSLAGHDALANVVIGAIGETTRAWLVEAGVSVAVTAARPQAGVLLDDLCSALAVLPTMR